MKPKKQDNLKALLERLQHDSASERADAAVEIGLLEPSAKAAVPALIEALSDDDAEVRRDVADALAAMGGDAFPAIPALIRVFTEDKNPEVRASAVWGLDRIAKDVGLGDYTKQVGSLLIDALSEESKEIRVAAAASLGNLASPALFENVIAALQKVAGNENEDVEVREVADQWIKKLKRRDNP